MTLRDRSSLSDLVLFSVLLGRARVRRGFCAVAWRLVTPADDGWTRATGVPLADIRRLKSLIGGDP